MPLYEFQSEDGSVITRSYPANKMPRLGKTIKYEGVIYARILSTGVRAQADVKPYVSYTLPKHTPGLSTDHRGYSVVNGRRQERETVKRQGW